MRRNDRNRCRRRISPGLVLAWCFVAAFQPASAQTPGSPGPSSQRSPRPAPAGKARPDERSERVPVGPLPANITVQLPTFGVAIDADGVLSVQAAADPEGRLHAQRLAAARAQQPPRLQAWSKLRKVSLPRLETALRAQIGAGKRLDETMLHLAGLQRIHYVFCFPDSHDIVLAGPAEGWLPDAAGRFVGLTTGQPVLQLDDLAVALRAYAPRQKARPFIGCTIDPSPAGLAKFLEFQKQIPRSVPTDAREQAAESIATGIRESLGMANVRIFGVPANTHFAQVLVEADYRMKLIGVGLEQPPVPMTTFASAIGGARQGTLERWWFTPNYDCVRITDDGLGMALIGNGVQLQGEDKTIGPDGNLLASGRPSNKASELFTTSFTRKYPELAARSPVYAQMRNLIDLVIAAAFIQRQDFYARAEWQLGALADEAALPVQTVETPQRVACVANAFWNGNRLLTPAGGGVSIVAHEALEAKHLIKDEGGKVANRQKELQGGLPAEGWWWD
jgi:hypothetical protein